MAKLFANSRDPDQMPHSVVSDLGLHCLPITLLRVSLHTADEFCRQVAQLDVHPTSDQKIAGSTPARWATFFRGDLIMKYFLRSFSPFR